MNNKKSIVITAVVMFFMTTAFYLTPAGTSVVSTIKNASGMQTFSGKLEKMSGLIDKYYINEYDKSRMEDAALSAFAEQTGDPYTMYINTNNYNALKQSLGGDYQGIGVEVYVDDNHITVMNVFENSPAKKAGIQKNDKIIAVDGEKADGSNYQESINKIKGVGAAPDDNDVTITILRGGEKSDLTLTRESVSIDTVFSRVINPSIGYIRISDFGDNTFSEFQTHFNSLASSGIKGLIIDLRGNPGGMLETVVNISDFLLPEGTIVSIKDKAGNEKKYDSDKSCIDLPMCVLINENSASASEVLAGAIRDFKRGTLVGDISYGKGVVQSIVEFGDGSAFKLTTAKYYTPSGECIDGIGIKPDIEVSLPEAAAGKSIDELTIDEDVQLRNALQVLN